MKQESRGKIFKILEENPKLFDANRVLDGLRGERASNQALQLMIPDWERFKKYHEKSEKFASTLFCAEWHGLLDNLIAPVNEFICGQSGKARNQYIKDLQEDWFFKDTNECKLHYFNIFFGKPIELMTAYWFKKFGYEIVNLQAWDLNSADIFVRKDDQFEAIEVKYIPQLKSDALVSPDSGWLAVKDALSNLLSKFKKINEQLQKLEFTRTAAIVIEKTAVPAYFLPLETYNSGKEITLHGEYDLVFDLADGLDRVLIFSNNGFEIKPMYEFLVAERRLVRLFADLPKFMSEEARVSL